MDKIKHLFAYLIYFPAIKYVQKAEDRLGFKKVKLIHGTENDYQIMEHTLYDGGGEYCTIVRSRNKIRFWKECYKDWTGQTSQHPVFLSSFYHDSVESAIRHIDIHIKLESNN